MIKYTSIPQRTLLLKFLLFDKKRSSVTKDDCDEDVHNQSNIRTSQSNRLARHGSTKPHFGNSYSVYRHQALKTTSKWRTDTHDFHSIFLYRHSFKEWQFMGYPLSVKFGYTKNFLESSRLPLTIVSETDPRKMWCDFGFSQILKESSKSSWLCFNDV